MNDDYNYLESRNLYFSFTLGGIGRWRCERTLLKNSDEDVFIYFAVDEMIKSDTIGERSRETETETK